MTHTFAIERQSNATYIPVSWFLSWNKFIWKKEVIQPQKASAQKAIFCCNKCFLRFSVTKKDLNKQSGCKIRSVYLMPKQSLKTWKISWSWYNSAWGESVLSPLKVYQAMRFDQQLLRDGLTIISRMADRVCFEKASFNKKEKNLIKEKMTNYTKQKNKSCVQCREASCTC